MLDLVQLVGGIHRRASSSVSKVKVGGGRSVGGVGVSIHGGSESRVRERGLVCFVV